jgi:hypothetical protein
MIHLTPTPWNVSTHLSDALSSVKDGSHDDITTPRFGGK